MSNYSFMISLSFEQQKLIRWTWVMTKETIKKTLKVFQPYGNYRRTHDDFPGIKKTFKKKLTAI